MKFSIIMAVYNIEKCVENSVQSVLANSRTFSDFELIVVDDGSTDGSKDILQRFNDHEKVRLIVNEHRGLGKARNDAVIQAKGEYVLFVDGDDVVASDMLEKLSLFLEKRNVDMAIFQWQSVDEYGSILSEPFGFEDVFGMSIACWNKVYKKSLVDCIAFPESVQFEDAAYALTNYYNANSVGYFSEVLYYHTHRVGGISREEKTVLEMADVLKGVSLLNNSDSRVPRRIAGTFAKDMMFKHLWKAKISKWSSDREPLRRFKYIFDDFEYGPEWKNMGAGQRMVSVLLKYNCIRLLWLLLFMRRLNLKE